jgi:acyl dehydratase
MHPLRFSTADLDRFAALSHDRNPLHVDEAYARRTPFGDRVVFGVLSALRAIATLRPRASQRVKKVTVDFAGPVLVGVDYQVDRSRAGRAAHAPQGGARLRSGGGFGPA